MHRLYAYALLFLGCLPLASPAWGAANAVLSESLISVDPSCDLPSYQLLGTADFTTNDDGAGNDFIAVVFHDASGAFHDVDFGAVQVPNDNIDAFSDFIVSTPPFGSFFASRPLIARVHDIPDPGAITENTKEALELAVASPVIGVLTIDPAADALACLSKRFANWALRIDSMKNGGGQIVSTSTVLDLDGLGTTALTIAVPDNSTLVALFKAECSNDAANNVSWVNIDIRVDGVGLAPTAGTNDAFCTSNGTAGHDEWVMARTSGGRSVTGPSVRTVEVFGSSPFGGNSRIQDSELVVMVPEPAAWQQRMAGLAALGLLAWRRGRRLRPRTRLALWGGLAVACSVVAGAQAHADTVVANKSNNINQMFLASAGPTLLNLGGGTSYALSLGRTTRVAIFFTAECTTNAAGMGAWVDIDIRVDGTSVPESDDTDDAFCASTGGGLDDWVSAGQHVTIDLVSGLHSIEVQGQLQSGAATDTWWIGDLSLSVVGEEH